MTDRNMPFSVAHYPKENSQLFIGRLVASNCGVNYSKNYGSENLRFRTEPRRWSCLTGHHGQSLLDKVMGISRGDFK